MNHTTQSNTISNVWNVERMLTSSWLRSAASTMLLIILAPSIVVLLQVIMSRFHNKGNKTTNNQKHNHCRRRIQHALTGLIFYILSFILPISICRLLLSLANCLFYILHISRAKSKLIQKYYIENFGPLLREHERNVHSIPGAFWFLLGVSILTWSFSMDIVRTSLLCLSFGDPVASTIGMFIGGPKIQFKHGAKSLVGCGACFVTCVIISMLCMGSKYGKSTWILTGSIATLMESLSGIIGVDDNILIPLGTGVGLSFISNVYNDSWKEVAS